MLNPKQAFLFTKQTKSKPKQNGRGILFADISI